MEACGAKTRSGTPCAKSAGWGTTHTGTGRCKFHGGASPRAEVAGRRDLAIRDMLAIQKDADPKLTALAQLRLAVGMAAYYEQQVATLEHGDVDGPVGGGQWSIPKSEPHVHIRMLGEWSERVVRFAKVCVDIGVEQRRVEIEQEHAALMAQVLRGVLVDLGLWDKPGTERVVRRHLSLVGG